MGYADYTPDVEEILARPQFAAMLQAWDEREARPRIACSVCQFEYVKEEGHECGQGQIPTT